MRSSEVDGMETIGSDTVFDIKILPDRAHYALSHAGVAFEVAAVLGLKRLVAPAYVAPIDHAKKVVVTNAASELCRRYMACLIEHIKVEPANDIAKTYLGAIGQRAINTIVDATNMTMFDVGQPLHAFDADKVEGGIMIRMAHPGEKITLLDGREVELDPSVLVIADAVGPLAIAGVKGGKRAEVTATTKNIIIEAANFDPTSVRRTSTRLNLRNESSKRFENEITPHLAVLGMERFLEAIKKSYPEAKIGPITDVYDQGKGLPHRRCITIAKGVIERVIGVPIADADLEKIFDQLELAWKKLGDVYELTIPHERLDLVIAEDIAEEVVRLYGYEKITSDVLPEFDFTPRVEPALYVGETIKNTLRLLGFSEIITQTLGK